MPEAGMAGGLPRQIRGRLPADVPGGGRRLTRFDQTMNLSSLLYPATVRAHVQPVSKTPVFPFVGDLARRSLGLDAGEVSERSEERRVGNECVSTCSSRWWPYPKTKNKISKSIKD